MCYTVGMDDLAVKIGLNIVRLIESRKLTRRKVAERADLHVVTLNRIIAGTHLPSLESLVRILNSINVLSKEKRAGLYPIKWIQLFEGVPTDGRFLKRNRPVR